jgi:hypothetical protein
MTESEETTPDKGPSLSIKFIGKGDPPAMRHKGDHMQIVPPRQLLACFHCGRWVNPYLESSSGTTPISIYCAISKVFLSEHRKCRQHEDGKIAYVYLKRQWDDFMFKYPKQREEWEKDHNTKWEPTDWAKEYDEWVSLPFKKKGKKE